MEDLLERFDAFIGASRTELALLEGVLGAAQVETAIGEARHGTTIIGKYLEGTKTVLEVGAGLGVLSGFVASLGHSVMALEPGGLGFEHRRELDRGEGGWEAVTFRTSGVEDLDAGTDGPFDLIYSINVLEHVQDPTVALSSMANVLAPNGRMVHECPNYAVPFEPHFGRPLVPFAPARSTVMLSSSITDSSLWKSLNFITASQVLATAAELDLEVSFEPSLLARSIERLHHDEVFRSRHEQIGKIASALTSIGITRAVSKLPATWSTPMIFELRR